MEGINKEIISSEGVVTAEDSFISKDEFELVLIAKEEDGKYWVQKVDSDDKYSELFDKLEAYARNKTLIQPQLNLKCIFEYHGLWKRVIIQDIRNDSMKILVDVLKYRKVKLFRLMVSKIYLADEEEQQLAASSVTAIEILRCLPPIINSLEISQCGFLQCHAQIEKELMCTLICREFIDRFDCSDDPMLIKNFATEFLPKITKSPAYKPEIGEYLCGQQMNGDWYRGIVVGSSPNRLAAVDEARVFTPVSFVPLPLEYKDFDILGLVADLKSTPDCELAGQTLTFKVLEIFPSKGTALVILATKDKSYEVEATLTNWIPNPIEQNGIEFAKLKSGCEVQIVEVITQNEVYVQSKEPEEIVRRHHLELEIAKCALKRKPLRALPIVGQFVMALHKDVDYYRAHVVRVEGKTDIQVEYVDYGNEANVDVDQLFELPDELIKERSCVAKVKLKGVRDNIPFTEDARVYLAELIADEVASTCMFVGSPTIDGVVLKTPRDESINDRLAKFLKPKWEENEEEELFNREILTINQLTAIKLGNVGDQIESVVIGYFEMPQPIVVLTLYNDERTMRTYESDVDQKMQEYVKNTPNHHFPSEGELCIALHDGYYYRGFCVTPNIFTDESRIFFVDLLNLGRVEHKNIRMMSKEFLDLESLAVPCSISPMMSKEKFTANVSQRLGELLVFDKVINIKIISKDNKTGIPHIDIPDLREKLYE